MITNAKVHIYFMICNFFCKKKAPSCKGKGILLKIRRNSLTEAVQSNARSRSPDGEAAGCSSDTYAQRSYTHQPVSAAA